MTKLPDNFTEATSSLCLCEDFETILIETAKAGRQFSLHNSDAENRAILNEVVKSFTDRVASLVWLSGGDMDTLGDSGLAYQQNVDDAFEPVTLREWEARRARRKLMSLQAAE